MKKRKKIILFCGGVLICILSLSVFYRSKQQNTTSAVNQITVFSCTETFVQKFGKADSEALKQKLEEVLTLEISGQEQGRLSVKLVSDYADTMFCFEIEQEVKAEECSILLEVPGFEHRFYGTDHLVNLYLQFTDAHYLLGTACLEDEVYFLPLSKNEVGVFYDDGDIRKMLEQYEEEYDRWEYIWLDGWKNDDTLLARTAQEVYTELPGTLWEAVEGSEKEILLGEAPRIICVELHAGHEEGYQEISPKNFHSFMREGGSSNVYFVAWKDGRVECMINIFIS